MTDATRLKYLRVTLRALALFSIFGFYPLTIVWPDGWVWTAGHSEYLDMIVTIYATLGVFLWIAAGNPSQHRSLISFAIWSSIAHGTLMAVHAVINPVHIGHLYGDVPALFFAAALLAFLAPSSLWMKGAGVLEDR